MPAWIYETVVQAHGQARGRQVFPQRALTPPANKRQQENRGRKDGHYPDANCHPDHMTAVTDVNTDWNSNDRI